MDGWTAPETRSPRSLSRSAGGRGSPRRRASAARRGKGEGEAREARGGHRAANVARGRAPPGYAPADGAGVRVRADPAPRRGRGPQGRRAWTSASATTRRCCGDLVATVRRARRGRALPPDDHVPRGSRLEGARRQRLRPRRDGRRAARCARRRSIAPPTLTGDDGGGALPRPGRPAPPAYGCPVVGGDISRGPALTLAVTALGRTRRSGAARRRPPGRRARGHRPAGRQRRGARACSRAASTCRADLARRRRRAPSPAAVRASPRGRRWRRSCTRCSTSRTASRRTPCGWPRPAARRR